MRKFKVAGKVGSPRLTDGVFAVGNDTGALYFIHRDGAAIVLVGPRVGDMVSANYYNSGSGVRPLPAGTKIEIEV